MPDIELIPEGSVAVIALSRPAKRNAMNLAMQEALPLVVDRVADDPAFKAVVLTSVGADFCVGGDREITQRMDQEDGFAAKVTAMHRRSIAALLMLDVPLIGAVEGAAFGFGAELAACCDIVVLSETARLADPHVLFGREPGPVVLAAWPRQTSSLVAAELILTGREVPAAEAVALGLANRLVPAGAARAEALAMAQTIAALPPEAIRHSKRMLRLRMADIDPFYPQNH